MMFLGTTRKAAEIQPEQKWDAISLRDFHSSSVFTCLAYSYLHFSIILSLVVYGVDIFTAINLLAFNQWSSSIEPTQFLTFDQTKWIFAGTIIASFVNLIFEHFRAWRVMRRGSVAECYLDNLAVRLESTRFGKGQGWRRFLVFAELTKSRKGAEYVALFSYFSLQSWIRVLVCSGPRQVVNALTLYGIYTLNLTPTNATSFESTIGGFFSNIRTLAAENTQQAVILSGMLFTLVIWVFSFLFLLLGVLFYVFFLWHYIPRQDGGLHGYCERKVNKRLKAIVTKKINKALAKEDLRRAQAQDKLSKLPGDQPLAERQATLPSFMDVEKGDELPEMPMLNRNDTMATLPMYTSRPGTPGSIELSSLDQKRPLPSRQATNGTMASASTYSSRTPLVASAAEMGFDRSASPAPTLPKIDFYNPQGPPRVGSFGSNSSFNRHPSVNGLRSPDSLVSMPERVRSPASGPDGFGGPSLYSVNEPTVPSRPLYAESRSITAPSIYSNRGPRPSPAPSGYQTPSPTGPGFSPARSATTLPAQQQRFPPQRNMTAPQPIRQTDERFSGNTGMSGGQRNYGNGYNYNGSRY
ncbi:putative pheromone-regulated membrane protein [Rosellinia necatrix]|uniref:Putative pheromone-regulated membrane protein n=1 Tax=Rosellinia necatrix TaxID=77044 RepID=A0A1W2TJD5_ROSNE|nr:putative pheromone-regulated membrane protein [Rosellinia necatrix]